MNIEHAPSTSPAAHEDASEQQTSTPRVIAEGKGSWISPEVQAEHHPASVSAPGKVPTGDGPCREDKVHRRGTAAATRPVGEHTANWILRQKGKQPDKPDEKLVDELVDPMCTWYTKKGRTVTPETARRYLSMILTPRKMEVGADGSLPKSMAKWVGARREQFKESSPATAKSLQREALCRGYALSDEEALLGIEVSLRAMALDINASPQPDTEPLKRENSDSVGAAGSAETTNASANPSTGQPEASAAAATAEAGRTKRHIPRDPSQIDEDTRAWIKAMNEERAYATTEIFTRALCGWHSATKDEVIAMEDSEWLLQAVLDTLNPSSAEHFAENEPAPQQSRDRNTQSRNSNDAAQSLFPQPDITDTTRLSRSEREWRRDQPPPHRLATSELLGHARRYIGLAYKDHKYRQGEDLQVPEIRGSGVSDLRRAEDEVHRALRLLERGQTIDRVYYQNSEFGLRWVYDELRRRTGSAAAHRH
jgi:hypothetical protein